jgi:hypothetical protein
MVGWQSGRQNASNPAVTATVGRPELADLRAVTHRMEPIRDRADSALCEAVAIASAAARRSANSERYRLHAIDGIWQWQQACGGRLLAGLSARRCAGRV